MKKEEARIRFWVWLGIEHKILVWWIPEYKGDSLTKAEREREREREMLGLPVQGVATKKWDP